MGDLFSSQRREEAEFYVAPSLSHFKAILKRAGDMGTVTWSKRFKARCALHSFDTLDAVNSIRRGRIVSSPVYDEDRHAWRVDVADLVDERTFVVDVALDCESDFAERPHVEIVTARFRRGGRQEVKDWN
jgi:hypothetical protein